MPEVEETRSEKARRLGPPTYDRLKKKKPRTRTVTIYLDDDLAEQVDELRKSIEKQRLYLAKVRTAKGSDPAAEAELEEAQRELAQLEEELEDETVVMKFRAIGRKRYEKLIGEHPALEEDVKKAKKDETPVPEFNADTFAPALVGASCFEPDLSEGSYWDDERECTRYPHAEEIFEEWNQGELTSIYLAAFQANTQRRVVGQGNG